MVRRHKNLVEQRIEAQREEQLKKNGRVSRVTKKQDIKTILKLRREEDISKSKEFSFVVKESSRIDTELKKIPFKTLQEANNFISKLDPKIKERITTNPQKQFDNQLKVLEDRVTTTKKRIASSLEDEREASSKSREDKAEARTKGYEKELIELNKTVTDVKLNNSFIDTKKAIDFADKVGDNEYQFQKERKEISRKKKEAKSKSLKLITAKAKTQILSSGKTTTQPKQLTALDKTIATNLAKRLRAGETLSATHQKQATKLLGSDNVKEFSNVGKIIKDIDKGNFKVAFRDLEKKGIKDPRLKEFVIAKASNEFDIKKFKDLDTTKFFLGTQQVSGLNKAKTDLKQSLGQQTSFNGYQNTYNQIKAVDNELKNRKGNLRAFDTNTFNVAVNILNNQIKKRQVQTQQVRNINATIIKDFKNSGVINKEVAQTFIRANNDKTINPQAVTSFLVAAGKQKGSLKDLEKLKKDVKDNSFLQFLSKIGKVAATPDTKNVKSSIKFFKEAEVNPAFKKNPFNKEVNAKLLKSLKDFPNQTENILNAHFNFISKATLGIGKGLIIDFAGGTIKSFYELGKGSVKLGGYLAKKTRESTIKETSRLKKNPKLRDEKAKLVKEYFTNAASINNFNDLKNNFNPKESKLKESAIVNHPKRAIELLAVMSLATGYSFTNVILSKMIKKTKSQPYRTLGLVIGEVATIFTPTKVVRGINLLEKGLRVTGSKIDNLLFSVDEFSKLQKLALSIGKKTSKLTRAEKDTLQVYKIQKELKFLTSPQSDLRKVESTITKVKTGKKITAKETRLLNTFEDNLNSSLIKLEKKQNKIVNNKKALTTLFTKLEKAPTESITKFKKTLVENKIKKFSLKEIDNEIDKINKVLKSNVDNKINLKSTDIKFLKDKRKRLNLELTRKTKSIKISKEQISTEGIKVITSKPKTKKQIIKIVEETKTINRGVTELKRIEVRLSKELKKIKSKQNPKLLDSIEEKLLSLKQKHKSDILTKKQLISIDIRIIKLKKKLKNIKEVLKSGNRGEKFLSPNNIQSLKSKQNELISLIENLESKKILSNNVQKKIFTTLETLKKTISKDIITTVPELKTRLKDTNKLLKELRNVKKENTAEKINKILSQPKGKSVIGSRIKNINEQISKLKIFEKKLETIILTKGTNKSVKVEAFNNLGKIKDMLKSLKKNLSQMSDRFKSAKSLSKVTTKKEQEIVFDRFFKNGKIKVSEPREIKTVVGTKTLTQEGFTLKTPLGDIQIIIQKNPRTLGSIKGKKGSARGLHIPIKIIFKPKTKQLTLIKSKLEKQLSRAGKQGVSNKFLKKQKQLRDLAKDYAREFKKITSQAVRTKLKNGLKQIDTLLNEQDQYRIFRILRAIKFNFKFDQEVSQAQKQKFLELFKIAEPIVNIPNLALKLEQIVKPVKDSKGKTKTPKKTTTPKKIVRPKITKDTKPIKTRKFKTTKRIIDEEIIKIKKLPKLDPESKNKLLVNRILIVEGRYRERINPRLPASKKNKVIPKTLKLKTTMNRALKELGELADRKAIRSIEPRVLGITNKKVQDIKRPAILHKFNIRKTKKALILVEQSKYTLDSTTEQNELRILKKKKKQAFKPKKKTSIKSKSKTKKKTTPKKKTSHPTASSGTKKKKKGSPQKKAKKGKSKKKTSSKNKTKKFNQVKTTKKSIKLNFKTKTGKKVSFKATKIIKKKKKSLKKKKK